MALPLSKPGEPTLQEACTASLQFAVRDGGRLDLMLHQRSSDVVLGLPHDVVAWSALLHLVCRREVRLRTSGAVHLIAGELTMSIAAAHVYEKNRAHAELIAARAPLPGVAPTLAVLPEAGGLFDIANDDERGPSMLKVQGYARVDVHDAVLGIEQAVEEVVAAEEGSSSASARA